MDDGAQISPAGAVVVDDDDNDVRHSACHRRKTRTNIPTAPAPARRGAQRDCSGFVRSKWSHVYTQCAGWRTCAVEVAVDNAAGAMHMGKNVLIDDGTELGNLWYVHVQCCCSRKIMILT